MPKRTDLKSILIIGAGANRKITSRMLLEFVEKTGIPFVTTQLGKGVIDEWLQQAGPEAQRALAAIRR